MLKPNGYDEAQVLGEFTPIQLGGHKLVIKQVEELTGSNGNQYIKVSFDTTKDDVQPNYYTNAYKQDSRDVKKWSGVTTVFPTDYEGKTSRQFKTFCTSVEKSNPGFKMVWGAKFCISLKDKLVGGVFGEEEYYNSFNELKTARKLFWFRSIDGVMDAEIPNKRTVEQEQPVVLDGSAILDGFSPIDSDDDLPF